MNTRQAIRTRKSVYIFMLTMIAFILPSSAAENSGPAPLKEAKLIIEHNATDKDTGFQGFIDGEGWKQLVVTDPHHRVIFELKGQGELGDHGITELFFETVEPENRKVPIEAVLGKFPEGRYTIEGPVVTTGDSQERTSGAAWLTHMIPEGPVLKSPPEDAQIDIDKELEVRWLPVTKSITGSRLTVIAYQLIVEKEEDPHPHMIGNRHLSIYLPASVTSISIPKKFLEPKTDYKWEVLAIESSGNQTLSSRSFTTR